MLITTIYEPGEDLIKRALDLAAEFGGEYVPRQKLSIVRLHERDNEVVVVTKEGVKAYRKGIALPFFFHPDMAMLRIKRLRSGDTDVMVTICNLHEGSRFLDCTLGLASDALVASYAVGQKGRVVGIESEPILFRVVAEGLKRYRTNVSELKEAMSRIEVIHCDHLTFLRKCKDNSFDVVYFDPMFFAPIHASVGLEPLRPFANNARLAEEAVAEAKRVAAQRVVMKNHTQSEDFARLGFERAAKLERSFTYGVIVTGGA
ncbi:class I SAM-dependent methyltransferase [Aneurinibacillus terranovensis]|uniref:class I SAM-dependent methyltransferase n=1 Tax=Aneurinibacillus terranovensis TaxID=278991 RepID=UPI0003F8CC0F|nr:class I SAM-dependent methyltransferase [Aneurinibacillus terranovensis]